MAYIIERNNRFYVVAYDGLDSLTRTRTTTLAPSRTITR